MKTPLTAQQEDFHSFHWSIVFLAMGGIALGKATLSSGLLDDLDRVLEHVVEGLGLYSILMVFSLLALVIATLCVDLIDPNKYLLTPAASRTRSQQCFWYQSLPG